jgi:tRNA U54 and U55 pseudouridine synthase Pus10
MEHITVKRETLDKVYKAIKKHEMKEITFEFLVGSCFPDIMNNIKEEMRRQYTLGYAEGLKTQASEQNSEE